MKKTIFLGSHCQPVQCSSEETLLAILIKNKIKIDHSCDGMGSCGTCRVIVKDSPIPLPERSEVEKDMASERNFSVNERLACQIPCHEGLVIEIPISSIDISRPQEE